MTAPATDKPGSLVHVGVWDWTVHPTSWMPTEDDLASMVRNHGIEAVSALHRARERHIELERENPMLHGWENPIWGVVRALYKGEYTAGTVGMPTAYWTGPTSTPADDILLMGGNRGGKTELGAKLVQETLTAARERIARCWSQNEKTSVGEQQKMMFRYMPPHLRAVKRQGMFTKIAYTQARGFTDNTFVLPNRSQAWLLTYNAWRQDKTVAEGGEADVIWCDEEVPADLLDTLRFRTGVRKMRMFVSFTPIEGYTEACAQYLEGADIIETIPARRVEWDWRTGEWSWGEWMLPEDRELVPECPKGHVPLVLRHRQVPGRYAVMLPTVFNPYISLDEVVKRAEGRPMEFRLTRWFGWPTKRAAKAFPAFSRWHIVPESKVPDPSTLTIHHLVDPHGRRNWFMLWLGVDADGVVWVFDEWPDVRQEGEWAVPGDKPDGRPGPGQRYGAGRSFTEYKRLILRREGWQRRDDGGVERPDGEDQRRVLSVEGRWMDPRPAGSSVPSDDSGMTYLEHMCAPVLAEDGVQIKVPGLDFAPAPGCRIEEGTQFINDWLSAGWDPALPVTPLNMPRFFVSERCENLIYSLKNWTGDDGEKGASKDPIDCLKAAAKLGLMERAAEAEAQPRGGWAY